MSVNMHFHDFKYFNTNQTSLSNKSQKALILLCSTQALFSPQPFGSLIPQSAHMVLRGDTLQRSQLLCMKRSQLLECLSPWQRALRSCRIIKIAGTRMPELAFSMSSDLFPITNGTFLLQFFAVIMLLRGHLQKITHQVCSRNFVWRNKWQPFSWLQLCWIYTLHSIIHIRRKVKIHRR